MNPREISVLTCQVIALLTLHPIVYHICDATNMISSISVQPDQSLLSQSFQLLLFPTANIIFSVIWAIFLWLKAEKLACWMFPDQQDHLGIDPSTFLTVHTLVLIVLGFYWIGMGMIKGGMLLSHTIQSQGDWIQITIMMGIVIYVIVGFFLIFRSRSISEFLLKLSNE